VEEADCVVNDETDLVMAAGMRGVYFLRLVR